MVNQTVALSLEHKIGLLIQPAFKDQIFKSFVLIELISSDAKEFTFVCSHSSASEGNYDVST